MLTSFVVGADRGFVEWAIVGVIDATSWQLLHFAPGGTSPFGLGPALSWI